MTQDSQQNPYEDKEIDTRPAGERIKDDFSFVQVFTSILSAVTSMILAPKIGIIGGVLGVIIGAAVAASASQIYKSVLSASADKLKATSLKAGGPDGSRQQARTDGTPAAGISRTQVMSRPVSNGGTEANPYASAAKGSIGNPATGTPIAPAQLRAQAQQLQRRSTVKMLVIVSMAALAAVFIYAAAVNFFTKGQGLGARPEPIVITQHDRKPDADGAEPKDQSRSKDGQDSKDKQDKDGQGQSKDKDDTGKQEGQAGNSNGQDGSGTGDSPSQDKDGKQNQNGGNASSDQSSNTGKDNNKTTGNQDQGGVDAASGSASKN